MKRYLHFVHWDTEAHQNAPPDGVGGVFFVRKRNIGEKLRARGILFLPKLGNLFFLNALVFTKE